MAFCLVDRYQHLASRRLTSRSSPKREGPSHTGARDAASPPPRTPPPPRCSRAGELLDAVVVQIRDVDVPAPVGCHTNGPIELSVAHARAPPRVEEGTARIELLDAVVVQIRGVDVPARVGRHAAGAPELSVARADTPPHGE